MSGCNGSQNRSFFKKPVTQDSESVIKLEQICHKYAKVLFSVFWWQLWSGPRLQQEQLDSYRVWFLLSRLSTSAQKVIRSLGVFWHSAQLDFWTKWESSKWRHQGGDTESQTHLRSPFHSSSHACNIYCLLCVWVFCMYVYSHVHHGCAWCLQK